VGHERPDLEELRENLVKDTGENKALLKQLEDTLLQVSILYLLIFNFFLSLFKYHVINKNIFTIF